MLNSALHLALQVFAYATCFMMAIFSCLHEMNDRLPPEKWKEVVDLLGLQMNDAADQEENEKLLGRAVKICAMLFFVSAFIVIGMHHMI